jgi:hypothetical protein
LNYRKEGTPLGFDLDIQLVHLTEAQFNDFGQYDGYGNPYIVHS